MRRIALTTAGVALLALAFPAIAFAKVPPHLKWASHPASIRAGKLVILELDRTRASTCTVQVSGPHHQPKTWTYTAPPGDLGLAIRSATTTTAGRWTFLARCIPSGTTTIERAGTSLTVTGSVRRASSFIIGRAGPFANVPLRTGLVGKPVAGELPISSLPSIVGKGGDPGNDYPYRSYPQDSRFDPWGEYVRECTSFAAWALYSRNGFTMPFYANAIDWGTNPDHSSG